MQALIDLAREEEEIQRIATRAMASPDVQALRFTSTIYGCWNGTAGNCSAITGGHTFSSDSDLMNGSSDTGFAARISRTLR